LVDAVRAGCTAHFEELVRRHKQRQLRAAFVLNDDEAEDVVQQAYVSVFEHLAQLAGHALASKGACSWGARSTPPRRDLTPLRVNVARA
jgi:hypothetical protein